MSVCLLSNSLSSALPGSAVMKYSNLLLVPAGIVMALASSARVVADEKFSDSQVTHFQEQVVGILVENCLKCHSGAEPEGGLDLTSRTAILHGGESGPAVDLADRGNSVLLQAIRYDGYEMPPTGRMAPQQIEALTQWVQDGLAWPADLEAIAFEPPKGGPTVNDETRAFWSFQPVRRPDVPESGGWGSNEIDRFIYRRLQANEMTPSPKAQPAELVRRASYDLLGLPPDPADVAAFEANPTPEAWRQLIDRLLESPHYGEHW
ncbi:MAG: DUF1549 domain-containing protein, partial [Planctomycetaceae bacterium]|nr:DUF1549 domain-containing protein [Planctomycetaceae bacterium]